MSQQKLLKHCCSINQLFYEIESYSEKTKKAEIVKRFRKEHKEDECLLKDLDFCFEVLSGKHKTGYTYTVYKEEEWVRLGTKKLSVYDNESVRNREKSIREFYNSRLKNFKPSDMGRFNACIDTPPECREFFKRLVNRKYKLGYSDKDNMVKKYTPMLAKKYPDDWKYEGEGKKLFVQEKLDGNRCIAVFDSIKKKWEFYSRSGKQMKVSFDMSWASELLIYDGEVMTLGKAGTRDFSKTSGAINSKFGDKSDLHYFIYDIIDEKKTYTDRYNELKRFMNCSGANCTILESVEVSAYPNIQYNWQIDEILDKIVNNGGEGVMLRDPDSLYQCGKRSAGLLKYKKTQTMDLRIVDYKEGKDKYDGMIGSFLVSTDDGNISTYVSGISDDIRKDDPKKYIGRIVEVAYFDISQSKDSEIKSLRFPRIVKFRDDKNETSEY